VCLGVNGIAVIEQVSDNDIDSVFSLMKLNMEPYYSKRNEEWNELSIRKYFLNMKGLVMRGSTELKGFSFYEPQDSRVHIHTLQISPRYQNRNLGGRFLQWYRKLAIQTEAEEITCGVFETNTAREMYRRIGFNEIEIVDGVVRMSLPLTSQCCTALSRPDSHSLA